MKIKRLLITLTCAALAAFTHPAHSAPGDLDVTFGGTGKVTTTFGENTGNEAFSVAVQNNGKIVAVGHSDRHIALVRFNTNGTLDTTFNGTGKVITEFGDSSNALSVVIQNDGRILVAGYSISGSLAFALVRYNVDGSLDTTFGTGGKVTTGFSASDQGNSVVLQSDGRIVVAGIAGNINANVALARYNTDGSLDMSFNGTGKVTTDFAGDTDLGWSVAIQDDEKLVVAGTSLKPGPTGGLTDHFAVARYNMNGSLDSTFGAGGKLTTAIGTAAAGHSVALQSDGRIVVEGQYYSGSVQGFALVRYNVNGSLDTSFGSGGIVTSTFGQTSNGGGKKMVIQNDGKIVVAATSLYTPSFDFTLLRYNSDGNLDTTFGTGGVVTTDFGGNDTGGSVALLSYGRIVVAGVSTILNTGLNRIAVARYQGDFIDTDGDDIPDVYETGTGVFVSPTDTGTSPTNSDSDGDGLNDGSEISTYHTNPTLADTDADGFDDGFEISTGFSPTSPTSTPDVLSAALPAVEYRFNAALGVSYRIEASFDLTSWTTIETPIIGTGGVIRRLYFIDGQVKRFFRSRRN